MKDLDLSVVILLHNCEKFLPDLLCSLKKQKNKNFEMIFVDNFSSDNSLKMCKEAIKLNEFNNIIFIDLNKNYGFAQGNNIGAKRATNSNILFLNPDTKFDDNFFDNFLNFFLSGSLDLANPKILNFKGIDTLKNNFLSFDYYGYPGVGKKCLYLEGSALIVKKDIFNNLGCFDKDYFIYGEDIDLCWRAKIFGYKLGIINDAVIYHYGGGSQMISSSKSSERHSTTIFRRYLTERNIIFTILKNYSFINCIIPLLNSFIFIILESFYYLFVKPKYFFQMLKIFSDVRFNFKKIMSKRNYIQNNRKLSDIVILKNVNSYLPNKIFMVIKYRLPRIV